MPKVLIPNRSGHDFSPAEDYGELVYLTNGPLNRYATNKMFRFIQPQIEDSSPEDYVLITGLSILSSLVASMFVAKHGKLNLLLFDGKTHSYIERRLDFSSLNETL